MNTQYSTGQSGRVRFGAMVGVMDEVDLLPRCLAHLAGIGVDRVLALDGGSTDGSLEWLHAHQGDRLAVMEIVAEDPDRDAAAYGQREGEAMRSIDADWVLCMDVDEFWLPAGGSLHASPQWRDPAIDLVVVPRYNVGLGPGGPLAPAELAPAGYADTWMFSRPIPDFRRHLAQSPATPWITGVPVAKVAVRPQRVGAMLAGWHGAAGHDGKPLARLPAEGLIAAHLPFTTAGRFRRKVANIRRLFASPESGFAADQAWHWRRWAALDTTDAVDGEFARQCLSSTEIQAFRANGALRNAASLLERVTA